MSEYQYYEFQAIDRALGPKEMAYLRGYSTRATITPTSFVNHYEWGNFKGSEHAAAEVRDRFSAEHRTRPRDAARSSRRRTVRDLVSRHRRA